MLGTRAPVIGRPLRSLGSDLPEHVLKAEVIRRCIAQVWGPVAFVEHGQGEVTALSVLAVTLESAGPQSWCRRPIRSCHEAGLTEPVGEQDLVDVGGTAQPD